MPALTTAGAPTLTGGACKINNAGGQLDRVQFPSANVLDETQSWVAARVSADWDNATEPSGGAGFPIVFSWRLDSNNRIELFYSEPNDRFETVRVAAAAGSGPVKAWPITNGLPMTLVMAWEERQVKLSVNGLPFVVATSTPIPDLGAGLAEWGGRNLTGGLFWMGDFHWAACGLGKLTDGDVGALHELAQPKWDQLPHAQPTFLWTADDFNYQDGPPKTLIRARSLRRHRRR